MRWLHLAVIILFAAATTIFVVQNLGIVTISFLGSNAAFRSRCWLASSICSERQRAAACLRCCVDRMTGRDRT